MGTVIAVIVALLITYVTGQSVHLLWIHFYSWGQCSLVVKIFVVCGDVILLVVLPE